MIGGYVVGKALIVDDSEQNLYLLQTMLKGSGYDVRMAANGVEALEQARRDPPDIVISDILMPVMDGFTLCREWRKDERLQHIPFVFYTATYTDPRDEKLALSLGAARFVVKPQAPEAFAVLLRQVIEERKTGRPVPPVQSTPEETDYYRLYSESLIRKLEDKMLELQKVNQGLGESEKKYRLLAENVQDVIFVLDMDLNYVYVSPSVKTLRGYDPEEAIRLPASETLTPASWDLALKTLAEGMEREETGQGDLRRSWIVELEVWRRDGSTVWTEMRFSFIRDEKNRPTGILGVTRDITERKEAEGQLQQTLEQSPESGWSTTIQVMVSAVETRDPYTAGHQIRSADLARAIATEMGLSQEKIDGIRMAGSIHDIGKLSIPAEILSKPTKLTDIEFSLIKEHSRRGYEMLKDVESPWPLAEIVYQHHERMNGSGYPRNLKGDEILIEARILSCCRRGGSHGLPSSLSSGPGY